MGPTLRAPKESRCVRPKNPVPAPAGRGPTVAALVGVPPAAHAAVVDVGRGPRGRGKVHKAVAVRAVERARRRAVAVPARRPVTARPLGRCVCPPPAGAAPWLRGAPRGRNDRGMGQLRAGARGRGRGRGAHPHTSVGVDPKGSPVQSTHASVPLQTPHWSSTAGERGARSQPARESCSEKVERCEEAQVARTTPRPSTSTARSSSPATDHSAPPGAALPCGMDTQPGTRARPAAASAAEREALLGR